MPDVFHVVMKPSILPPLMSLFAAALVCGPPWLMSSVVNHGRVHPSLTSGFGTQTVGLPFFIGIPSASGKVPKYWSRVRRPNAHRRRQSSLQYLRLVRSRSDSHGPA